MSFSVDCNTRLWSSARCFFNNLRLLRPRCCSNTSIRSYIQKHVCFVSAEAPGLPPELPAGLPCSSACKPSDFGWNTVLTTMVLPFTNRHVSHFPNCGLSMVAHSTVPSHPLFTSHRFPARSSPITTLEVSYTRYHDPFGFSVVIWTV